MKLPLPFLLYTTSLGLVGFTGWQVYELLPVQKKVTREAAMEKGMSEATSRLSVGKGKGQVSVDWQYTNTNRDWWEGLKKANFLGKLPPPPPDVIPVAKGPEVPPPPPIRPLEEIIELVSLVYDSGDGGKGELSHVIVRYKPESGVQPPEYYVREHQAASAGSAGLAPRDSVPPPRAGGNQKFQPNNGGRGDSRGDSRGANRPQSPTPPPSIMPTATMTGELLQSAWVQSDGNVRLDPHLWAPFTHIRLVRVSANAQSAFFVRETPPAKEGDPIVESAEEELWKTAANLSSDVKRELNRINGQAGEPVASQQSTGPGPEAQRWMESDETTIVGKVRNVGRKDAERFQTDDAFLEKIYLETYVSSSGKVKGLQVRNVDSQLASRLGVGQGEVLLSVNGRAVTTKAATMQFGKKEYEKGVRTFVTVWLAAGQEVERIYQLPDK